MQIYRRVQKIVLCEDLAVGDEMTDQHQYRIDYFDFAAVQCYVCIPQSFKSMHFLKDLDCEKYIWYSTGNLQDNHQLQCNDWTSVKTTLELKAYNQTWLKLMVYRIALA